MSNLCDCKYAKWETGGSAGHLQVTCWYSCQNPNCVRCGLDTDPIWCGLCTERVTEKGGTK